MLRHRLRGRRNLLAGLLVAMAAIGSSISTRHNFFAQDDVPLVIEDARAHDIKLVDRIFTEGYWPPPYPRDLYRPLTSLLISLEWQMGGGAPFSYKCVQIAIYAASSIAVLILALQLLPFWGAVAAALFFAVHPVHVEAVALAVNQAEVIVGLIASLAVAWYINRRREGPLDLRAAFGLGLTTLIAAHFKETGLMIAPLLVATELFVIPATPGRWRLTRPVWLVQLLAGTITIAIRSQVQTDRLSGTFIAEVFEHSTVWNRFETMLRVVPEWLRLHLWPATLQADYSPQVITQATGWAYDQWLGLAIIVLVGVLAIRLFRRAPIVLFGVAWVAIALFPVSNVLVPTGIPMAERTLFLSSIGAMLAVVAFGLEGLRGIAPERRQLAGRLAAAFVVVVAILGVSRSYSRHKIWRNSMTMWSQTVVDAPDGYRSWVAFGSLAYRIVGHERGINAYHIALRLYDKAEGPIIQLAEWYRVADQCPTAIPLYYKALALREFAPAMASLAACLAWEGDYAATKAIALRGLRTGYYGGVFHVWFRTALDAERSHAPIHTVRFPAGHGYLFNEPAPNPAGVEMGGKLVAEPAVEKP
ncbi:MAG: hypothetical protein V4503_05595 [Gemmatimonadota bacterium]